MWVLRRASANYLKASGFNIAALGPCAGLGPVNTHKEDTSVSSELHKLPVDGWMTSNTCNCPVPAPEKFSVGCRSFSSQACYMRGEEENDELKDGSFELETPEASGRDTKVDMCKTASLKTTAPSGLLKLILEEFGPSISGALDIYIEGKELSRSEVYQAMWSLRRRKFFWKALQLSEWLKGRDDFDFSERDYASMVDLTAKVRGFQVAESYIGDIPKSFRGEMVYRSLLANFASAGLVYKSEQLFNKMKDLGFPITTFTCDQMLFLYKTTDKRKMECVLSLMEKENLKPSLFTYQVLIDTKGRSNDIKGMEKIVNKMKTEGVEPTIRMQAILAKHYSTAGLKDKAKTVLEKMEGSSLKTERFIHSLVLPIYANLGEAREVQRIWNYAKENPQQAEILAAIDAFGKLKDIKQAEFIFSEMKKKYKKLSSRHYTVLLKVYTENMMLSKGEEILKQMRNDNCYIGPMAWDALVRLYVYVGEVEKADSMLQEASQQDQKLKLMLSSYMTILLQYSERGDVDNAEKIFQRMREAGYIARAQPFLALLQTYINAKVPAIGIRERMKANNMYPSKDLSAKLALVEEFNKPT